MKPTIGPGFVSIFLLFALAACRAWLPGTVSETPAVFAPGTAETAITLMPSDAEPTGALDREPALTPEAQSSCSSQNGTVQSYTIPWQGETLQGRIYTPACYDQDPDRSYPVLYLLHGATETDQQWDDLGVDELADSLISQGKIPALLIVMPLENTWLELPENPFGDQLVQGLLPWVEGQFRTIPDRQHRAVGGLSRGGNWAVRLGLLHWGLFGSLGAHSAPLFYGDLTRVPSWLEAIPAEAAPRIYLDISEGDNHLEEARAFRDLLLKAGVEPAWHLNPGLHEEAYWKSHLEEYLLWYSAGWDGR